MMTTRLPILLSIVLSLTAATGCTPDPIDVTIDAACEWSNPEYCMLPWPSERWLAPDHTTATGLRLQYDGDQFPRNSNDEPFDTTAYERFDGFSPASAILTMFSDAVDVSNLAWVGEFDESLAPDSPTVIVDLATGEHIAHFAEIDARAGEDYGSFATWWPTLIYLRPARRLQEGTRYGVAFRDIHLKNGTDATPYAAFTALRDGVITTDTTVEAARPAYETLFEGLEAAGVERASLIQAWAFTTASGDSITGDLLAARADALERVPVGAGDCTVTSVLDQPNAELDRIVRGTFASPLYMDADATGSRLVRGADGTPEFQGWASVPFQVNVPHVAVGADAEPLRMVQLGHGLMGRATDEMGGSFARQFGQEHPSILVGTDWQGMSRDDLATVGNSLQNVSDFPMVAERLIQGMVNQWVLTRSFQGTCRELPDLLNEGEPVIAADEAYFIGISQGGILGGTFMATSPDIERGTLIVGAMNFPFTMTRSLNWADYELILRAWNDRRIDREFLVHAMISLWDLAEPNAYLPHAVHDPLPDTPVKKILYQVAEGDLQVQTIAADAAVRTLDIPLLSPALHPVWGVEELPGPLDSAYVYYDLGEPLPAMENYVPEQINDVHNQQRGIEAAREQIDAFFRPDGMIENFCDGPCDPQ